MRVNLRRNARGGKKLDELEGTRDAFAPRMRLVLLIHGYNVSADAAVEEFRFFESSVSKLVPALAGNIAHVFWPGDYGLPLASILSYPWRVHTAIKCAVDLAKYVQEQRTLQGGASEVVLIAHSLGCRLVVEALRLLPPDRNTKAFLMAAAYPAGLLLERPVHGSKETIEVFVSDSDWVLKQTFPVGERAARTNSKELPEAVGLRGLPDGTWKRHLRMSGYAHGDYWRSQTIHSEICRALGFAVPLRLPVRQFIPLENPLRSLPSRELKSRL